MPLGLKIHVGECEDLPAPWWAYYVLKCAPKLCVDKSVCGGFEVNTVFLEMLYTVVEGAHFDLKNIWYNFEAVHQFCDKMHTVRPQLQK